MNEFEKEAKRKDHVHQQNTYGSEYVNDHEVELLTKEKSMDTKETVLNSLLSEIDSLEDLLCDIDLTKPENLQYLSIAIGRILSLKSLMKEIMKI